MYLEKHLKTIELMEYELRHRLKEYDLDLSNELKDEKEWYTKSQKVKMVFGNNIVIDYQEGIYIVFKEKNLNFNLTEGKIKVNELDEYNLVFEGKNLDKGNTKVFIVEYNRKKEKIKVNSYPLNTKKNLKFEKDTRFIRIAFKTEGIGTSIISNFNFSMKKKSKDTNQILINDFKEISNEFDKNFINNIQDYLKKIPSSNGSKYYKTLDINVAIIADEFLFNSYKGIANFIYITPENYKDKLEIADCFFIASTWRGLNNEWNGLCYEKNDTKRKELYKIIEYAKLKDIKTIFYSKEDPVNYNIFIETAKKCDYIYTTAEEKIKDYIADCGHNRVEVLEFGINPLYHNPIGLRNFNFNKKVLFSGSWYEKYSERCSETIDIFNGVLEGGFDLKIIDRNFNVNHTTAYKFPEKYNKYISPGVKHDKLQKLHKLYNWAINLNTIKDSNTMFANRVYELQAMGNILISNYSIGVNNKFPNVFLIQNGTELKFILNTFTDYEVYSHQMFGVRNCLTNHSNNEKLEKVFEIAGVNINRKEKKVLILCDKMSSQIKESFTRQTYNNKELKLIKDFTEKDYKNSDIIGYFSEKYFYEEFYIENMLNCFKFTDCDYITKDIYYKNLELDNGIHNNYINYIKDCNRTLYWKESFEYKNFLNKCLVGNISRGYSSDPLEILDSKENKKINLEKKLKISVIIPTYNNGNHLLNKCFNSLRRSTIFNEMEIIIVDDGSTDKYTPNIVKRIARKYSNVKTFFYGDGGSGSASRPRNKGHEISTTDYITYLDPDNEAINDGYFKLYDKLTLEDAELVVGNMLKLTDEQFLFNVNKGNLERIVNSRNYLVDNKFPSQSTQALLIKKQLIKDKNIDMVNGAIGEDTLFFHELVLNSSKTFFINEVIHLYYAAVDNSTVNSISEKFYKKHLILEKERLKRLKDYSLLDEYKKIKFEYYFKNWYLKKLEKIKIEDYHKAKNILKDIFYMYSNLNEVIDDDIKKFIKN